MVQNPLSKVIFRQNKTKSYTQNSKYVFGSDEELEIYYILGEKKMFAKKNWYFVTIIVLTYCEKKLF